MVGTTATFSPARVPVGDLRAQCGQIADQFRTCRSPCRPRASMLPWTQASSYGNRIASTVPRVRLMPELPSRAAIEDKLFADETVLVRQLAHQARLTSEEGRQTHELARQLVAAVRAGRQQSGRDRCLHAGICALLRRGRGAHVPRRGAACAFPTTTPPTSSSPTRSAARTGNPISASPNRCSSTHRPGA